MGIDVVCRPKGSDGRVTADPCGEEGGEEDREEEEEEDDEEEGPTSSIISAISTCGQVNGGR